jgi:hypothetical protein
VGSEESISQACFANLFLLNEAEFHPFHTKVVQIVFQVQQQQQQH